MKEVSDEQGDLVKGKRVIVGDEDIGSFFF